MGKGSGAEGRTWLSPILAMRRRSVLLSQKCGELSTRTQEKTVFYKRYLIGQSIAFRGMLCFFCGVCEMKEKRGKKHEEDYFYRRGYRDRNAFV